MALAITYALPTYIETPNGLVYAKRKVRFCIGKYRFERRHLFID